jgi:hypothetical protein
MQQEERIVCHQGGRRLLGKFGVMMKGVDVCDGCDQRKHSNGFIKNQTRTLALWLSNSLKNGFEHFSLK